MLTEQQVRHFETFGFVVMRQVFTAAELETLNGEFIRELEAAYGHAPFDGSKRHWKMMLGPDTPFFAGLPEDERFCVVAEQLYGEDVIAIGSDANRYVGDTRWHPDTGSIHQYGVKFAYYLQPVGSESGALRLIPGSHREPLHGTLREKMAEMDLDIDRVPAHVCTAEPGDVVAFDLRCWHASCGGGEDRRMCTLVYYNNPKNAEEEQTTAAQIVGNINVLESFGLPKQPFYHPHWWSNPDDNPRRRRWIERLEELGYVDPYLEGEAA